MTTNPNEIEAAVERIERWMHYQGAGSPHLMSLRHEDLRTLIAAASARGVAVEVTQVDRVVFKDLLNALQREGRELSSVPAAADVLAGKWDHDEMLQIVARHRLCAVPSSPAAIPEVEREAIARAIGQADSSFGYTFNMTKLVDGVATHTLTMPGYDPEHFEDRDDGYRLIEERRNRVRADAILALFRTPPAPAGEKGDA